MKHLLFIVAIAATSLISNHIYAQELYGTVTYMVKYNQSETDEEIFIGIPDDMVGTVKEQIAIEDNLTYTLDFDENSSYYRKSPTTADENTDGMMIINMDEFIAEHYMNMKDNVAIGQLVLLDETFIISSTLRKFDWKFEKETKVINGHACKKATLVLKNTNKANLPLGEDIENDALVTAWYTPDVKAGFGPEGYWGLPGLILEIDNGTKVITCSKILLNPKDKITINPPSKGKKVTKEELLKILGEMLEQK